MRDHKIFRLRDGVLPLLIAAAVTALTLIAPAALDRADRPLMDLYRSLLSPKEASDDMALILIGEPSLRALGRWPWPRSVHGRLVDRLAPAKTVVLDFLFPEATAPSEDRALASAVAGQGNVVVAAHLGAGPEPALILPQGNLARSAAALGVANVVPDVDGLYRQTVPLWPYGEKSLPSLALAAHLAHSGEALEAVSDSPLKLRLGGRDLPLDGQRLWLPLIDETTLAAYEYVDVLEGRVDGKSFAGKLVIVGVDVAGIGFQDLLSVPRGLAVRPLAGPLFLALAVEALREREPLRPIPATAQATTAALFSLAAALIGALLPARRSILLLGTLVAAGALAPLALLAGGNLWFSPLGPLAGTALLFPAAHIVRLHALHRESERQRLEAFEGTVKAIVAAVDAKDPDTRGHSERVAALASRLGREMDLPDEEIEALAIGALLHDVGKIGIPDSVLQKPDRLTEEEYTVIRSHPLRSREILEAVPLRETSFRAMAEHHEKLDGSGYPDGLAGDAISLSGRILAVADTFDALLSRRVYKEGWPLEKVLAFFRDERDKTFDGAVIDALESVVAGWEEEEGPQKDTL